MIWTLPNSSSFYGRFVDSFLQISGVNSLSTLIKNINLQRPIKNKSMASQNSMEESNFRKKTNGILYKSVLFRRCLNAPNVNNRICNIRLLVFSFIFFRIKYCKLIGQISIRFNIHFSTKLGSRRFFHYNFTTVSKYFITFTLSGVAAIRSDQDVMSTILNI